MNTAPYCRFETVTVLRNCKVLLRVVALAFAIVATLGAASEPLRAQTQADSDSAQNQAGLKGVLQAIAAGVKVSPRASLPLQVGFYRGQPALYITPEVGVDPNAPTAVITAARQLAVAFRANFIPQNFGTLPGSPAVDDIYSFTNFPQGNVIASAPRPAGPSNTSASYSPLWQVSLVSWNSGRQKRELTSETAIQDAAAAGDVTIAKTPIIVECSVIFTPGGGLLPGAIVTGGGSDTK